MNYGTAKFHPSEVDAYLCDKVFTNEEYICGIDTFAQSALDEIFHILKVHFSHIEWSAIAEQNTCSLCWIEDGHLHHIKFDYVPQESEEYEEE